MTNHVHAACPRDCYDSCALVVTLDGEGRPVQIGGDPEDAITRGIGCPRSAGDIRRLTRNRVETPHIRDGERLVPAGWDDALARIASRLSDTMEHDGPESILYLDYAGHMGLLTSQFTRRFWNAIGATMTDGAVCAASGKAGIRLHYGDVHGVDPADIADSPLIVFWGFNAAVSAPHIWHLALQARKRQGAVIAAIDPVRTRTATAADVWLRPAPGTDVALAYGIIRELIHTGTADSAFIEAFTSGFSDLEAAAEPWTPERVREVTGIGPDPVRSLCRFFHQKRPAAVMIGIGLQKSINGADQVRAVSLIPAVLGVHRGFYYSSSDAHTVDTGTLSGRSLTASPGKRVSQVNLGRRIDQGRFRHVHIHGHNPAITLPNQAAFRRGLASPDVFVSIQETHWTRTAEMADVVLPALTYLEKADLVIPWSHSRIRWSYPVVAPYTDGWEDHAISTALATRLGLEEPWLYEDPLKAVCRAVGPALDPDDAKRLENGESVFLQRRPRDSYRTPSGTIELSSSAAAAMGLPPLPIQKTGAAADGLRYLQSATAEYTHSQFTEVYGPIPATIDLNPEDAAALGIADGDMVNVENAQGTVSCSARVTDRVPPGTAWSPRQFEDHRGRPQNAITSGVPQDLGGGSTFNSTHVRVHPME